MPGPVILVQVRMHVSQPLLLTWDRGDLSSQVWLVVYEGDVQSCRHICRIRQPLLAHRPDLCKAAVIQFDACCDDAISKFIEPLRRQ